MGGQNDLIDDEVEVVDRTVTEAVRDVVVASCDMTIAWMHASIAVADAVYARARSIKRSREQWTQMTEKAANMIFELAPALVSTITQGGAHLHSVPPPRSS